MRCEATECSKLISQSEKVANALKVAKAQLMTSMLNELVFCNAEDSIS